MDEGIRVGTGASDYSAEQPHALQRGNGCATLFFYSTHYQDNFTLPRLRYGTSTDGVTFDALYSLGIDGNGPDIVRLHDGTYLLYYDVGTETTGFSIRVGRLTLRTEAADLSIAKSDAPDPVQTRTDLTYTLTIHNDGPDDAMDVTVVDTLPPQTIFRACAADGDGICGGINNNRTVEFGTIPVGALRTVSLRATVLCGVADGTVINNTASVTAATLDPDSLNDSAFVTTTASNPPPAITDAAVDKSVLWPPDHRLEDVVIDYDVTDNCPLPVDSCSLSVSSNEPEDGLGDGDLSPDWEVVDAGHVRLRAERSGLGSGRVYTIAITCTDLGGDASTATTAVLVPHSLGAK